MERDNPFADLNEEFKTKPRAERPVVDKKVIEKLSEEHNFPSRRPAKKVVAEKPRARRNATGRNQQINIKTTADAIALLYELADSKHVPLGKVFEDGLAALKKGGY